MKPVLILTISFFLPLFAFLTNLPLAFSNNNDINPVRDTNDKLIFSFSKYYILPANFGPTGGGLKLSKTGNSNCPLTVLQDYSSVVPGLPVRFNLPGISPGIIFSDTPLDIEFVLEEPPCTRSTKWWVFVDKEIEKAYVAIGGPEIHPHEELVSGTFNIQKYGYGYKLVFCVADSPTCLNIVGFEAGDENGRRLILSEHEAFNVVFVEAYDVDGIVKSVV